MAVSSKTNLVSFPIPYLLLPPPPSRFGYRHRRGEAQICGVRTRVRSTEGNGGVSALWCVRERELNEGEGRLEAPLPL